MKEKVLILTTNLDFGGSERRCVSLSLELKKLGYHVEIVCFNDSSQGYFSELLNNGGVPIIMIKSKTVVGESLQLRKYIKNNRINTVISILYKPNIVNCLSAIGGHGWKVIVGEPSAFRQAQEFMGKKYVFKSNIMAKLFRFSDYVVCNSCNASNSIISFFPQYKDKVKVIYNPVNIGEITAEYKIRDGGKIHFCVAASFQMIKNPMNLAKALSQLSNNYRDKLVFDWYGHEHSKELCDMLRAYISNNNLGNCFRLHEATKDITNRMYQADCVALFSAFEGLPNAICEGLVIGKPILMTRCSDYNILVDKNGILCAWDNVDSIKKAIECFVDKTDQELEYMGEQSKKIASKVLNKEDVINKWCELLEQN